MRHQQVHEACAADLRDAVLRRDEKVGGERHQLPADHEGVSIVREEYEAHAGQEHVVLQAKEARRHALAVAKVAR
jgi:hypothetical protein